jgi:hypothetical protein
LVGAIVLEQARLLKVDLDKVITLQGKNMLDLVNEAPIHISEVQELFGVGRSTVEGWFTKGLEWCKVGGKVYTTREAIARFAIYPDQGEPTKLQCQGRSTIAEANEKIALLLASFKKPRKSGGSK